MTRFDVCGYLPPTSAFPRLLFTGYHPHLDRRQAVTRLASYTPAPGLGVSLYDGVSAFYREVLRQPCLARRLTRATRVGHFDVMIRSCAPTSGGSRVGQALCHARGCKDMYGRPSARDGRQVSPGK